MINYKYKYQKYKSKYTKLKNSQYGGENYNITIKFCIIFATFNRKNGKSPFYLNRCINSIINQTYTNWDLVIVGDKYEPENELLSIIDNFKNKMKNNNKIIYLKNDKPERDYLKNKLLWYIAGATSLNMGLKYCRENGYKYYCHIDDDDYWGKDHLNNFCDIYSKYPNCIFSNSQSTYKNFFLPFSNNTEIKENNLLPKSCTMVHSSISFRIDIIPYQYHMSMIEKEIKGPSDAILLNNINDFLSKNKQYCAIYTGKLTCYHDIEGETILKN